MSEQGPPGKRVRIFVSDNQFACGTGWPDFKLIDFSNLKHNGKSQSRDFPYGIRLVRFVEVPSHEI